MGFTPDGVEIQSAQRKSGSIATDMVSRAESLRIHAGEPISPERNAIVQHAEKAFFRGALRIVNTMLDHNVKLTGQAFLDKSATERDYYSAMDALDRSLSKGKSVREISRFYQFYIEKTVVDGREIILCSCSPRGYEAARELMFGRESDKAMKKRQTDVVKAKLENHTLGQTEKPLRTKFIDMADVSGVYRKLKNTRPHVEVDDGNKPIYVFQGLHPSMITSVDTVNTSRRGGCADVATSHVIHVGPNLSLLTLAHEFAHSLHVSEPNETKPLLFTEGDAVYAELQLFPNEFNLSDLSASTTSPGLVARLMKDNRKSVKDVLFENAKKPREEQDYLFLSSLGLLLATSVRNEYGMEFWDVVVKKMSKNYSAYIDFISDPSKPIRIGEKVLTFDKCCELIEAELAFFTK